MYNAQTYDDLPSWTEDSETSCGVWCTSGTKDSDSFSAKSDSFSLYYDSKSQKAMLTTINITISKTALSNGYSDGSTSSVSGTIYFEDGTVFKELTIGNNIINLLDYTIGEHTSMYIKCNGSCSAYSSTQQYSLGRSSASAGVITLQYLPIDSSVE